MYMSNLLNIIIIKQIFLSVYKKKKELFMYFFSLIIY